MPVCPLHTLPFTKPLDVERDDFVLPPPQSTHSDWRQVYVHRSTDAAFNLRSFPHEKKKERTDLEHERRSRHRLFSLSFSLLLFVLSPG